MHRIVSPAAFRFWIFSTSLTRDSFAELERVKCFDSPFLSPAENHPSSSALLVGLFQHVRHCERDFLCSVLLGMATRALHIHR